MLKAAVYIFVAVNVVGCFIKMSAAMGCFRCQSINGSDPRCEDPFRSALMVDGDPESLFVEECLTTMPDGRKDFSQQRSGLYPSSACLKIKGTFGETLVIRSCSVDGGSRTQDTELVRIPEARGHFQFVRSPDLSLPGMDLREMVQGTIVVCDSSPGCNTGASSVGLTYFTAVFIASSLSLCFSYWDSRLF